jgi:3-isopropylmalate/(R)-2-methylmalate dehydratase small subunit
VSGLIRLLSAAGSRDDDRPARQTVLGPDHKINKFDIDPFRKHCLVNGLDDIGLTLAGAAIKAFEIRHRPSTARL